MFSCNSCVCAVGGIKWMKWEMKSRWSDRIKCIKDWENTYEHLTCLLLTYFNTFVLNCHFCFIIYIKDTSTCIYVDLYGSSKALTSVCWTQIKQHGERVRRKVYKDKYNIKTAEWRKRTNTSMSNQNKTKMKSSESAIKTWDLKWATDSAQLISSGSSKSGGSCGAGELKFQITNLVIGDLPAEKKTLLCVSS